ncbi:MAG: hypothetical protein CL561_06725 [Alphaproteobacteria bacterium]|nr:hypothetical protein [Alphaproteobacteria bacterium]|tara:strand:+ start:402 stop:779 length:378 start_codon:yes stop_codon:yes gene_type:complete
MTLQRVFIIFLLIMFGVSAVTLYNVSQAVQRKERVLAAKTQELAHLKEERRLLQAEWSYLNRPDRLEKAAQELLDTKQISIEKVTGDVEKVPEPLMPSHPPVARKRYETDVNYNGTEPAAGGDAQ